jgi:cell division septal protein FtsQ
MSDGRTDSLRDCDDTTASQRASDRARERAALRAAQAEQLRARAAASARGAYAATLTCALVFSWLIVALR